MRHFEELIATATVVWHELLYGCFRLPHSRRRHAIEQYLHERVRRTVQFLDYTAEAAAWHATERARLELLGQDAPFVDGQIAATATVNGLVLVTNNVRDFEHFDGLKIENWFR
jgi:tRNA(fMet)-specific endonuclease VapC